VKTRVTFASLAPPGEPAAIRHIGDRIGNWRLEKIEWDRVWLRAGGSRCAVGMHVGAREAGESVGGTPETPAPVDDAPARAPTWELPRELVNAIEKLADASFAVDRAVVPAFYARAADLLAGIRITPLRKNEAVAGITLERSAATLCSTGSIATATSCSRSTARLAPRSRQPSRRSSAREQSVSSRASMHGKAELTVAAR
jgi:general secretion pathway protein C